MWPFGLAQLYTEFGMIASENGSDPLALKIGRRIAGARVQRSLSQADVARIARTSTGRISALENGKDDVRLDTLARVASAVGLEVTLQESAA